jgi:hypothetical protein
MQIPVLTAGTRSRGHRHPTRRGAAYGLIARTRPGRRHDEDLSEDVGQPLYLRILSAWTSAIEIS